MKINKDIKNFLKVFVVVAVLYTAAGLIWVSVKTDAMTLSNSQAARGEEETRGGPGYTGMDWIFSPFGGLVPGVATDWDWRMEPEVPEMPETLER